jgi:hypothetical protein
MRPTFVPFPSCMYSIIFWLYDDCPVPSQKQKSKHFNGSEVSVFPGPNMGFYFLMFLFTTLLYICRLRHSSVLREPKPCSSTKLGTGNATTATDNSQHLTTDTRQTNQTPTTNKGKRKMQKLVNFIGNSRNKLRYYCFGKNFNEVHLTLSVFLNKLFS